MQLERSTRPGDTITVVKPDSEVIKGVFPTLTTATSALYLKSVNAAGQDTVKIPAIDIDCGTYRKQTHAFTVVGLIVGLAGGAAVGAALAPEPQQGFTVDMTEFYCGIFGAIIGGVAGAGGGAMLDRRLAKTVTIPCR